MYHKILADGFFVFAGIAILASMYSWSIEDIFLASTQWVLIAIVMLLMAIYIRMSKDDDEEILSKMPKRKAKPKRKRAAAAKSKKRPKHVSFRLTEED